MNIFVGTKAKPTFLLELDHKHGRVMIYTPDSHSKKTGEFYEKYALGKKILDTSYSSIIFTKDNPVAYSKAGYNSKHVSELIIRSSKGYILVNSKLITKLNKI